jgi:hypothetical protein
MTSHSLYALASRAAVVATFIVVLSGMAQAENISIDWFGGSAAGTGAGNQTQMLPTDVAGVVPLGNWNSFIDDPAIASETFNLNLSNGAPSGATITITGSPNDWDTNINETLSPNHKMMLGYVDTNNTTITNLAITGLPASVTTGGYNVIVYYDGENGTEHRVGRYEVNGVSQWGKDAGLAFSGTFTQGQTSVDPLAGGGAQLNNLPATVPVPAGNYMVFGPLSGPDFTLRAQASVTQSGTARAAINGLQIIQIPEPATMALIGVGVVIASAGVVVRRRRSA